MAPAYRTSASGTALAASATAVITPAVGDHFVVAMSALGIGTATCTDDNGGTYTLVTSQTYNSGLDIVVVWVRDQQLANTTSTTVTVNAGAGTHTCVGVFAASGMSLFGSSSIKQSAVGTGATSTTPATTFSGSALTKDITYGFVGNQTNPATITPPTNWTERFDIGVSGVATGLEGVSRNSGFTSTTITWGATTSGWGAVTVELDCTVTFSPTADVRAIVLSNGAQITKTGGTNSAWDGGAASNETFTGDGYVEAYLTTKNKDQQFFGLSITDSNLNYTSIKYAWYLNSGGTTHVYESGSNKAAGSFKEGDRIRIRRTGTTITYEQVDPYDNVTLFYTSLTTTASALLIDTSFFETGTQLQSVRMFPAGVEIPLTWKNASTVTVVTQAIGASYSTANRSPALGLTEALTIAASRKTVARSVALALTEALTVASSFMSKPRTCALAWTEALTIASSFKQRNRTADLHVFAFANGAQLTKTGGTNTAWDGGAASNETLTGDGYVETYLTTKNAIQKFIGLSITDTNLDETSIKFAFYINSGGTVDVYENGTFKSGGPFKEGDRVRVRRTGTTITYEQVDPYDNVSLRYTSLTTTSSALLVDTSFFETGSQLQGIRLVSAGVETPLTWKNASTVAVVTQAIAASHKTMPRPMALAITEALTVAASHKTMFRASALALVEALVIAYSVAYLPGPKSSWYYNWYGPRGHVFTDGWWGLTPTGDNTTGKPRYTSGLVAIDDYYTGLSGETYASALRALESLMSRLGD